jgi:hypothetical protein
MLSEMQKGVVSPLEDETLKIDGSVISNDYNYIKLASYEGLNHDTIFIPYHTEGK